MADWQIHVYNLTQGIFQWFDRWGWPLAAWFALGILAIIADALRDIARSLRHRP